MGIYLSGTAANSNTRIEVLDTKIHGFLIGTFVANDTAQGMFAEDGASFLLLDRIEVFDNGAADDHDPFSNHGVYLQANDMQITNSSFHDNHSGYGAQFYNGGAATTPRLVIATIVALDPVVAVDRSEQHEEDQRQEEREERELAAARVQPELRADLVQQQPHRSSSCSSSRVSSR